MNEYDDIRPFIADELPDVYDRLICDDGFKSAIETVYNGVPYDQVCQKMRCCHTNESFQVEMVKPVLDALLSKVSTGLSSDFSSLSHDGRCFTFISNHRDIVLDSALLDYALLGEGLKTVEIAIGDNLLIRPWIKDLVRVNKSFIVQRSLNMRQMLVASSKMSRYMHYAVNDKHENLWIAQREGRAKDSDDRTQESVLKMMAMGGSLRELNIVPLAISYEYDPCDWLKAEEFQHKRDIEGFKKSPQDDLDNMRTGIFGYKGHIHYHAAPCINAWLDTLPQEMPKAEYFKAVAEHIDIEIHRHYRLYPCNYIAMDLLDCSQVQSEHYTDEDKDLFETYLTGQLEKVKIENADMEYLRERILTMYANPARNNLKSINVGVKSL